MRCRSVVRVDRAYLVIGNGTTTRRVRNGPRLRWAASNIRVRWKGLRNRLMETGTRCLLRAGRGVHLEAPRLGPSAIRERERFGPGDLLWIRKGVASSD